MVTAEVAREINVGIARNTFILDVVKGSVHPFHVFTPVGSAYAKAIFALNVRKMQVIVLSYGTEDGEPKDDQAVASILGLSSRWVRRLRCSAMRELRQPNILARIEFANYR